MNKALVNACEDLISQSKELILQRNICLSKKNINIFYSYSFRRSIEVFESFTILLKNEKTRDSVILLRSYYDLVIDTLYFASIGDDRKREWLFLAMLLKSLSKQIALSEGYKIIIPEFDNKKLLKDFNDINKVLEKNQKKNEYIKNEMKKRILTKVNEINKIAPGFDITYKYFYRLWSGFEHHDLFHAFSIVDKNDYSPRVFTEEIPLIDGNLQALMFACWFLLVRAIFETQFGNDKAEETFKEGLSRLNEINQIIKGKTN